MDVASLIDEDDEWNEGMEEEEAAEEEDDNDVYWDQTNPEDMELLRKFEEFAGPMGASDEEEEGEIKAPPPNGMPAPTPDDRRPTGGPTRRTRVSRGGHEASKRQRDRMERVAGSQGEQRDRPAGRLAGRLGKRAPGAPAPGRKLGITTTVCRALSEKNWELMNQIVRKLGRDVVIRTLSSTVDKERDGGLLTADGARRRTPGGVFLKMLADDVGDAVLKPIYAGNNNLNKKLLM
eukprot:TRINITY_DN11782_c0_g1_i2.p1 TRINITY_DN11782_c0_g1~~TRINITY_DN11782_c0_g1_i2.p1  ORF type:complete len:235 (+),score=39.18 TRINITY_DN11782_c0_g1_i2:152-856(+)